MIAHNALEHVLTDSFNKLKLIEIVILWVHYTIPFAETCFGSFWTSLFNVLNYFAWLRITDEGLVPEMRIWSILLIKCHIK